MTRDLPLLALAPAASLILSLLATRWLAASAARLGVMDLPNERSLHQVPVPRTGGLAVLLGLALPLMALALGGAAGAELAWLGAALALVALPSFVDDLGHVPPWLRLLAHVAAALLLLSGGLRWSTLDLPGLSVELPATLSIGLTLLFVVWMINLYNFMDGMDGLAGGMAVFGFGALALLGWSGGEPLFALVASCVAAAAAGFLGVNFPPARIFLGDTGSSSLGLLAAGLALWGVQRGLFPLWSAWLAFSPFIVDATWTLATRIARRERVWEAHRSHHYQRLVLAGWSHRHTLLRAWALMAAAAACAVASPGLTASEQWLLIAGWAVIYWLVHLKVDLIARLTALDADTGGATDRP